MQKVWTKCPCCGEEGWETTDWPARWRQLINEPVEICAGCARAIEQEHAKGGQSTKMRPGDPASRMLFDGVETTPIIHRQGCYICEDPEFARMGLPLCRKCPECGGHITADDSVCDDCGFDEIPDNEEA